MKILNTALALLTSLYCCIAESNAATIVISQPTFTALSDYSPSGFGQSFSVESNYSVIAINLYISSSSGGSDFTLRIYEFNSSASTLGSYYPRERNYIGDRPFHVSYLGDRDALKPS